MSYQSFFIEAKPEDFAPTVLMPGDPLRAKHIAETFFTNAKLINKIRGILGYTGEYKGKKVSVLASGMGMPSMAIYAEELFNHFSIENIIRVGTAGCVRPDLKVRDIVIGQASCTNSNFISQYNLPGTYAPIADYNLLEKAVNQARKMGIEYKVGNLYCTDYFFDYSNRLAEWQKMGVLAVEMESAALYTIAAVADKQALCICTISDNPFTGEMVTPDESEKNFNKMIELALEIA